MTKRGRLLIAAWVPVCFCLMLGIGLWILLQPSYVPREQFERIEEGMTEAEVESILGQPGTLDGVRQRPGKTEPERWIIWQVDYRTDAVMGFQNGRVSTGTSWRIYVSRETMHERICRWLQLR